MLSEEYASQLYRPHFHRSFTVLCFKKSLLIRISIFASFFLPKTLPPGQITATDSFKSLEGFHSAQYNSAAKKKTEKKKWINTQITKTKLKKNILLPMKHVYWRPKTTRRLFFCISLWNWSLGLLKTDGKSDRLGWLRNYRNGLSTAKLPFWEILLKLTVSEVFFLAASIWYCCPATKKKKKKNIPLCTRQQKWTGDQKTTKANFSNFLLELIAGIACVVWKRL